MVSRTTPEPVSTTPEKTRQRRGRRGSASEEAVLAVTTPMIANWQAKLGWACAMWGLIPVLGLVLGASALLLGGLGYRRVLRKPEDLGIRHAVGALILGSAEVLVNVAGLACIVKGVIELTA